jgi:glycosyltransferase involved in cell wall biosynthesis
LDEIPEESFEKLMLEPELVEEMHEHIPKVMAESSEAEVHDGSEIVPPNIPADQALYSRQYYTMRETANMFNVNQSLLRFWENEFDILKPKKNRKGDRYFRPDDIKNLELIYHLLRVRKFTINGAKDYLKNKYKVKVAITVTPNCINPEKDIPSDAEVMELKSTIAPGKQIIGFVGSLFPYHGVDLLIQAHSKVVKDNKNAFLLIIGDGGIRPALQDMAKRILPSDSYLFAGKVPHKEVMKYIGIFDVAVMAASNWYGSPIKIFEYGLMGKAIIAPDNAPVRDAMRPGEDGILVQPDIDQIAIGIHRILKDETMGKQMGQNFKSRILKEFTWEIQAFRILSTLASPVDAG